MFRTDGRDVAIAMHNCEIPTTSQTRHVCKHRFSALPIDKNVVSGKKLDYHGIVCAHLATGCGINAKDPSGLDSDRWIPQSRCCEYHARAKALAIFSRHLSAWFRDMNLAPLDLPLYSCFDIVIYKYLNISQYFDFYLLYFHSSNSAFFAKYCCTFLLYICSLGAFYR